MKSEIALLTMIQDMNKLMSKIIYKKRYRTMIRKILVRLINTRKKEDKQVTKICRLPRRVTIIVN